MGVMEQRISIYHTRDEDFVPARMGEQVPVYFVYDYEDTFDLQDVDSALARVFRRNNRVDDSSFEVVPSGERSFSVGDVVAVGETAWKCASFGWEVVGAEVFG